jgi:hypothetical protein
MIFASAKKTAIRNNNAKNLRMKILLLFRNSIKQLSQLRAILVWRFQSPDPT